MSARPLLQAFLLICLIAGGGVFVVILGVRSIGHDSSQGPELQVWDDESNDLWIETPLFMWNITSGEAVSLSIDGVWQEWRPAVSDPGERVIDTLFLSPQFTKTLRSRVMFSLGDRTVVYIERDAQDGVEALELAFRAHDGVVRVTHAWIGDAIPVHVRKTSASLSNLEGQFVQEMMEGLSAEDRLHLAANYSFFTRFEPGTGVEYRSALGEQEERRTGRLASACADEVDSESSDPWARDKGDSDPCRFAGFFLPGHILGSEYVSLFAEDPTAILQPVEANREPLQLDAADLDAAYIMRTPRYSYRAKKTGPEPGEPVTFIAYVKNMGVQPTGTFDFVWSIDNTQMLSDTSSSLVPGEQLTLSLDWIWQAGPHTVTIQLDPNDVLPEVSERNNVLKDRTDALAVGFWVEQSVYDYFNTHQIERGLGSLSWEDWAQRQLRVMNQMFAEAIHPLTPNGILERVRLDKVTVVPDGSLPPCATHYPDVGDESVDLQWGFPAELVGMDTGHTCGELDYYLSQPDSQDVEYTLIHELSHARYLVDLYGINVRVGRLTLTGSVDSSDPTLIVDRNVGVDQDFPAPAYLALEGELVICQSKAGNTFTECERGGEGTTPRPHAAVAAVHPAVVRLQDGQGDLVQGSVDLPVLGDLLYRQRYPDDLMSGGTVFQQHSAYALNRIAGQRPCCGNFHAPDNLGEYLNDLPTENIVEVRRSDGQPLPGAQVEVYRAKPLPVWYGKVYLNTPDVTHVTDSEGRVHLGSNPFSDEPGITHAFGHSNAVVLLRIAAGQQTVYRFLDVTEANEAFWSGHHERAIYAVYLTQ
jgi:hypothetical protein